MMAKEIEEEVIELPDSKEEASTSLGALFANIKLDWLIRGFYFYEKSGKNFCYRT